MEKMSGWTLVAICAYSVYFLSALPATAVSPAEVGAIRYADFVVSDVNGQSVNLETRTARDVAELSPEVDRPIISGDIGTFWTADHALAYVQTVGNEYQLVHKGGVVTTSLFPIEQLGDISSELAYCETTKNKKGNLVYRAHFRGKAYDFSEPICSTSTLSKGKLLSYASQVYLNGAPLGLGSSSERIMNAFLYKNSLVYATTLDTPYETRLMVQKDVVARAPGTEGVMLDAAVQGGKLAYSFYKPDAGWSVMWGGEIVSRFHQYVSSFLKDARQLTYIATTPRGTLLFRGNKVYGLGYDTVRYMAESEKGNIFYITSKTTKESDITKRVVVQDALWLNGQRLLQSLYAGNYFARFFLIDKKYPLVVVETLDNRPQYIWYQGSIGLQSQRVMNAAEDGDRIALLVELKDGGFDIVYIQKEQ